jgi:hypothetical protein
MTVEELIEELKTIDGKFIVKINDTYHGDVEVTDAIPSQYSKTVTIS